MNTIGLDVEKKAFRVIIDAMARLIDGVPLVVLTRLFLSPNLYLDMCIDDFDANWISPV